MTGLTVQLRTPSARATLTPWRQLGLIAVLSLFSAAMYLAVSRYIVTAVVIQGRSMSPTLHDGDRCFMDRWTLKRRQPQRGDLVVIQDPGHDDYAVKRVVGMPGEVLLIQNGAVYINGQRLTETYLDEDVRTYSPRSQEQFIMLGQEHYFVLGDNRPVSEDSRTYGPLRRAAIVGLLTQ